MLDSQTADAPPDTPTPAPPTKLRIIHVFRAPVGGLFRHVHDLARAQVERGHEVGIFCDATTGGERGNGILASLSPLLALGLTRHPMRRNPHLADLAALRALMRLTGATRPHVVHTHGSKGGVYGRLPGLALRGGIVRVYTPHGGSLNHNPGSAMHWLYMRAERLLERATDVLSFESEYIAGRYRAYVGEPRTTSKVIWNGLHPGEFEPLSPRPDATDLVYIGEFRAAKGLMCLIDAMCLMRVEGRGLSATFVGSGPDEGCLRARLNQEGLMAIANILPPEPARTAMTRGRVMVVPSRAESLPYVILEAAAARMPLIATNVGGISEIFGPRASRLLPRDDPPALAAAIASHLDTPAAELAAEAAQLADFVHARFSVAKMADSVIAAYREAISRSRAPRV